MCMCPQSPQFLKGRPISQFPSAGTLVLLDILQALNLGSFSGREALPFTGHSTAVICSCDGFLHKHSCLGTPPSHPQTVSSQPTAVPLPESALQISPSSARPPCVCPCRHLSQVRVCRAVAWTTCVGFAVSCLPDWPLCSPLTSRHPYVPADLCMGERTSLNGGNLSLPSTPHQV